MNYYIKIVAIIGIVLLIVVLLIAHSSPATGYELDIYRSTPLVIWISLIFSFLIGTGIIIYQVVTKRYETSRFWLLGLLVLVISRFTLLYIPYIRGYVTWHGDNISHWGYLKDILNTGHIYSDNFYPITHSFISQTIILSDMPIQYAANLSTAFLSVLFILMTYLLATAVLQQKGQQLLATAIASTVMVEGGYNVFLMPNGWSILLLPLLFYFYFKRQTNSAYIFLFVILLIMYPLFHPLSGLIIVIALLILLVVRMIINLRQRKRGNTSGSSELKSIIYFVMLELAVLITWILSFNRFESNIRLIWEQITSGGPDILGGMGDTLSKINIHGFDVLILYLKLYGMQTILIILALIGLILFIRQLSKFYNKQSFFPCLGIGMIFLSVGLLYVLYNLGAPGLQLIGSERMIAYTMMFTPVLAALSLYKISQALKHKYLIIIILLIILAIPAVMSSLTLYQSPYNVSPNAQITQKNLQGLEWLISNKDNSIECMQTLSNPGRLAEGVLGVIDTGKETGISRTNPLVPDHFSYNDYEYFGMNISEDSYFVLNDIDRVSYMTVWKTVGRFTEEDFLKIENDLTVNRLYTNGEFTAYDVVAIQSE